MKLGHCLLLCPVIIFIKLNLINSTMDIFQNQEENNDEENSVDQRVEKAGKIIKKRKVKTEKTENVDVLDETSTSMSGIDERPCLSATKFSSVPRQKKFLSLFSWISFPNTICDTDEDGQGICYTAEECKDRNGEKRGTCASGYGVCCHIADYRDKAQVNEIVSYFQNEKFPSTNEQVAESREFTVAVTNRAVCQIRIDFKSFEFAVQNNENGKCEEHRLMIEDVDTNTFCGRNDNQHVYLYMDSHPHTVDLEVTISSPKQGMEPKPYKHNLMITQIDCNTNDQHMLDIRAPPGCLQYYYESTGTITSFNFDGKNVYSPNQDYAICIKKKHKNCGIIYTNSPKDPERPRSIGKATYANNACKFRNPEGTGEGQKGGNEAACGEGCIHKEDDGENDWISVGQGQLLDYLPLSKVKSYKNLYCGQGIGVDISSSLDASKSNNNNFVEGRGVGDYSDGPFTLQFHTDAQYTKRKSDTEPLNNLGFVIDYAVQNNCRS